MKFTNLLVIFILLLLPFSADALETHSPVIKDKSGNVIPKEKQAHIPDDIDSSDKSQDKEEPKETPKKEDDSNTKAGEAMILNALMELPYSIADEFQEGGFKLASAGVEETITGSRQLQYSLYSKELDVFEPPFIRDCLAKTGRTYYLCAVILICLAYWVFVGQHTTPQLIGKIQDAFSGEESYFDFKALYTIWVGILAGPAVQYYFIKGIVKIRNVLVLGMTTAMVDSINTSSDSMPTYVITRIAWYFNNFQKLIGEYGIYFIVSLTFILCGILALQAIFISLKLAIKTWGFVNFYFILLVFMDIITLYFVSFGVQLGNSKDNWAYVLPGIIAAVAADFLILIIAYKVPKILINRIVIKISR